MTQEQILKECKLCKRIFPNKCKRHRETLKVTRYMVFTQEQVDEALSLQRQQILEAVEEMETDELTENWVNKADLIELIKFL